MYGITQAGFRRKPYETILSELQQRARQLYGSDIDLSDASPDGLLIKEKAFAIDQQWKLAEDVYYGVLLDSAVGVALERIVAFKGLSRKDKQRSIVDLDLTGDASIIVPKGTQFETDQKIRFESLEEVQLDSIVEATVQSRAVEAGVSGNVPSNSITKIHTPVSGLNSVNNPVAAVGGAEVESDSALYTRFQRFGSEGGSSIPALFAALSQIEGVEQVFINENVTEFTDAQGLPPKSFEVVIRGGTDEKIRDTIYEKAAAGIERYGDVTTQVSGEDGQLHPIAWTRPTIREIYVSLVIQSGVDWNVESKETVIRNTIKEIGGVYTNSSTGDTTQFLGLRIGENVLNWRVKSAQKDIDGIEDITAYIDDSPSPSTEQDIDDIGPRELARTDTAKVDVTIL